jgi:uncharacterized protein YdaU (DUF1376 family)
MPLWVGDFLSKTLDLDAREAGAYLLLLMAMWTHGGRLPNDPRKLQRVARVGRDWPKVWAAIGHYFEADGDHITNARLREELHKACTKREDNARAGALGGRAKALKSKGETLANATVSLKQSYSYSEEEKKEKKETPLTPQGGGVGEFERVWPHYPRRVGKAAALKAWGQARKRADYPTIAAGLKACIRAWSGTPIDKIPHFATWLNRDGWLDDPGAVSNRPRTGADDVAHLSRVTAADDVAGLFADLPLRIVK